ncbi:proto-oncogene tyrosine-protein kinase ROS isoform X2 [Athalia rosae]|uniref:proto-oncogene tyrosine-protein kinase ROS isoform X2 n=1 Tax=Athalia rosae TaxID=37344 RepID=UPI0020348DC1|nr:proto-oncogene tyrosine-protein kinase ROS isoform X2 [Athalia rosae]
MSGIQICVLLLRLLALFHGVSGLLPEDLDFGTSPISLQDECAARCPDLDLNQNRTDDANSEVGCGVRCRMDQCTKGCAAWQSALETNCRAVCNGTQELLPTKQLYCVLGCHDALDRYFQQLKEEIGTPPAPALVADSLTATSLRLEWKGIDIERRGAGISYLVQWMYEELAETWQYCRNQSWGEDDQILVDNLQPYTKYRFRVALILKSTQHNRESIVSAPSVPILTKPEGLPLSEPVIVRAAAVDSCRVSVSWEPGPFPNGPLLSYVLRLQGGNYSQLKDIPASENASDYHYMFQNLKPDKNYSVSLTMRNSEGEGPPAVIHIATTPEAAVKDTQQPILILGGKHTVKKQDADMLEDPTLIYETTNTISGVAIHVASAQVFVSDSGGYVYRTSITERSKPIEVLNPDQINFKPLSLSVDWLNLHLYVLGEVRHATTVWQIARCDFDGRGLTIAVAGFLTKPSHIEVDPYNGYLFWVRKDGLFRLDLADISNGIKHETHPDLILEDAHLEAFMVDHRNFRLLVPHHVQNTVISVTLDGREVSNLRANTQQPKFKNVVSLAMANGLFYWTNGQDILKEDYHPGQDRYFHNSYPDRSCVSVNVLMDASQPAPVPVNPPTGVQAVLGAHMAKVSWRAPYLLGGQGKGAWQNWSYELEIKDVSTGEPIHQEEIGGSSHTVYHLRERSEYLIKAAAYTSAGRGPWSSEFRGCTLRDPKGGSYASILWSASEGLLRSDVTGENVETLIQKSSWKDSDMEYHIIDVAWYKDLLYLVGNNSMLYCYNMTSHETYRLHINSVRSVAVDWISKKLYWANPKQQIITRANLDGTQQEPMSILAIVKELMIDSLEAYLYWSTGHAVEVSRLNGQDRRYYHSDEIFNGKQVMGLTLDTENKSVYWIVRSYESGSVLYRAPTSERIPMNQEIVPEKLSALQHSNMQGPLCYFSEHLLWLQDDRNAVIGDLSGQNTAVINGITLSGLQMVAIMDHALHQYPKNLSSENITVLPSAVNVDSIRVVGNWSKFNVSWDPVRNTNYGTVFYEVKYADHINTNANPEITKETTIAYNNSERFSPYAILEVTIKAFTYWGMSHHTRKILRSPQAEPSHPTNPRGFVEFNKKPLSDDTDISIVFRWDQPDHPNGLILGYTIVCWYMKDDTKITICDKINVPPKNLEYKVDKVLSNTTYYFKVQAHTIVGAGWFTDVINISTEFEYPVPQILVATLDAVRISDLDRGINDTITRHIAIEVAYSAAENKIYWINEMQEMVIADIDSSNATKILALNNSASSLCVDWITRTLFWTESEYRETVVGSQIMRLDLTAWEAGYTKVEKIITTNRAASKLDISPLMGILYWIESSQNDRGIIMQSDLHGDDIQPFFNHAEDCSCPFAPLVRPVMAVDNTDIHNPVIYWVSQEGNLNIADIEGCVCNMVLSPDSGKGLPPTSLTVDKVNVYWSNIDQDQVYFINKLNPDDTEIKKFHLYSARSLKAIGNSLQPYPFAECLIPRQVSYNVELIEKFANSIKIKLPEPVPHFGCDKFHLPATLYTVYITECLVNDPRDCKNRERVRVQSYEKLIEAKNLKPFTKYMFQVGLSNYYSELESSTLELGPGNIIRTDAGAPTRPENVVVQALTPTLASINWMPPKVLNGAVVRYEIHWRSAQLVNGIRQKGEQLIKNTEQPADGKLSAMLQPLLPGQEYLVYVRAYSAHSTTSYNESVPLSVRMYPEPNNLTLTGQSINSMNVSWAPNESITIVYHLEYSIVGLEKWQIATNSVKRNDKVEFIIQNLRPRTLYRFQLVLRYPNYNQDFIWPADARFTFETSGDVPSAPGIPISTKLRGSVHQISWEPAQAHGSQITLYRLEGRVVEDSNLVEENRNDTSQWNLYYNGTDASWISVGEMNQKYQFRVQARNAYGFGKWSEISGVVDLTEAVSGILVARQHLGLVLGLSVPLILGVMLLCFGVFLCLYRQRKEDKKVVIPPTMPDVELATLREIPRGNFVQSNALYASAIQNDPDDSALPKIKREQITLAKFLGSGAFGEVFQGDAKDLDGPGITRVAIKTLRKGASAQEKTEFLQEARLMSHFKHKHVLRLLGVCLDTDPPLLVLELMKAGDLLTYLRASRPLQPIDPGALRLQDLLAMCEDVARGCRYLEELHFVHRDLACRNCLVSARDRENRVVKIGDFGLARDIYKNDYYRKEGEGLLPVRWMAPESLVDGVFTSQSDVWAFGVLMWEITSLGQQPYPARTNLEVLYHVRAGGRLPKPLNCPTALHQLMLRCWSTADARPSFKACLDHIITLRSGTEDAPLSPIHAGHYLSKRGVSNMAYFADENQNHNQSGNSWKSSSSEGSRDMQPFLPDFCNTTALLSSGEIPKYLELLADNDVPDIRDIPTGGYEVPRSAQILDKTEVQRESKRPEVANPQIECPALDFEQPEGISNQKRESATSTELQGHKRTSISSIGEKFNILDSVKIANHISKAMTIRNSPISIEEIRKSDGGLLEVKGSLTSLSSRSNSSHGSSASLAPSTRPSSSLINLQNTLPQKKTNGSKRNSFASDPNSGKNTISKLHRTHSVLQNGKANIPLAINSALLNSLRQAPSTNEEKDSSDVATYTNINSDTVRING